MGSSEEDAASLDDIVLIAPRREGADVADIGTGCELGFGRGVHDAEDDSHRHNNGDSDSSSEGNGDDDDFAECEDYAWEEESSHAADAADAADPERRVGICEYLQQQQRLRSPEQLASSSMSPTRGDVSREGCDHQDGADGESGRAPGRTAHRDGFNDDVRDSRCNANPLQSSQHPLRQDREAANSEESDAGGDVLGGASADQTSASASDDEQVQGLMQDDGLQSSFVETALCEGSRDSDGSAHADSANTPVIDGSDLGSYADGPTHWFLSEEVQGQREMHASSSSGNCSSGEGEEANRDARVHALRRQERAISPLSSMFPGTASPFYAATDHRRLEEALMAGSAVSPDSDAVDKTSCPSSDGSGNDNSHDFQRHECGSDDHTRRDKFRIDQTWTSDIQGDSPGAAHESFSPSLNEGLDPIQQLSQQLIAADRDVQRPHYSHMVDPLAAMPHPPPPPQHRQQGYHDAWSTGAMPPPTTTHYPLPPQHVPLHAVAPQSEDHRDSSLSLGCTIAPRPDGSWEVRASFATRAEAFRAMDAVMALGEPGNAQPGAPKVAPPTVAPDPTRMGAACVLPSAPTDDATTTSAESRGDDSDWQTGLFLEEDPNASGPSSSRSTGSPREHADDPRGKEPSPGVISVAPSHADQPSDLGGARQAAPAGADGGHDDATPPAPIPTLTTAAETAPVAAKPQSKRAGSKASGKPKDALPWDSDTLADANVMVLLDLDNWPSFFEKLPFEMPADGVLVAAFAREDVGPGSRGAGSGKAGADAGTTMHSMIQNKSAQRMLARKQLHLEATRPVKDSADAVLCMFAAEIREKVSDSCAFVLISEDAIFLQAQTTLQAKGQLVMLVRSRSYDEVATLVVQLNHQTMDQLKVVGHQPGSKRGKGIASTSGTHGALATTARAFNAKTHHHGGGAADHHQPKSRSQHGASKSKQQQRTVSVQHPGNAIQGRRINLARVASWPDNADATTMQRAPPPPQSASHHPPLSVSLPQGSLPEPLVRPPPPPPEDLPRQLGDKSQRPSGYEMVRRDMIRATPQALHQHSKFGPTPDGRSSRAAAQELRHFICSQRHARAPAALAARHLDANCTGWRGSAHTASLLPLKRLCTEWGAELKLTYGTLQGSQFGSTYVTAK